MNWKWKNIRTDKSHETRFVASVVAEEALMFEFTYTREGQQVLVVELELR